MCSTDLTFLYHTRTILRSPTSLAIARPHFLRPRPIKQLPVSSRSSSFVAPQGFFQKKANESKVDVEKKPTKSSTITGEEKKVFSKIFHDLTKADAGHEQAKWVKRRGDLDTDHETILALFSNSVKDSHTREHGVTTDGGARKSMSTKANDHISNYPRELQPAARRAARVALRGRAEEDGDRARKAGVHDGSAQIYSFRPMSTSRDTDVDVLRSANSSDFERPSFLKELFDIEKAEVERQEAFVRLPFVKSIALDEDIESDSQPDAKDEFDQVVDTVAKREMARIAQSFDASITDAIDHQKVKDFAIWNTCEMLVFPMLNNLDTKGHSRVEPSRQDRPEIQTGATLRNDDNQREIPIQDQRTINKTWKLDRLPAYIPPLSIISRLYPAALLLALRLFAKHCPKSPFALALLPQVRSEGVRNYVLGGTTPFYNTLIQLQWDIYSDLREIHRLLAEMEKSGIELDGETHDILVSIGEERWVDVNRPSDEKGPKGARSKAWWERREQMEWFDKVCIRWRQVIAARLREQGQAVSEREYGLAPAAMPPSAQDERLDPVLIG